MIDPSQCYKFKKKGHHCFICGRKDVEWAIEVKDENKHRF